MKQPKSFDRKRRDGLRRRSQRVVAHDDLTVKREGSFVALPRLTLFGDSRGTHQLVNLGRGDQPTGFVPRATRRGPGARARRRLRRAR